MSDPDLAQMTGAHEAGRAPEIGVGLLGYNFMGKAHSNAFKKLPYMLAPTVAVPRLVALCGRNEAAARRAARRYGYDRVYTDWREMLKDDRVQLFDNGGPNDAHAEPCIAAAQAGKHILCEKPLARNTPEAAAMLEAVTKAGVKHAVSFNYRFVPAVRLAKELILSGRLGQIYHYRAVYLQEWLLPHYQTPHLWRMDKGAAGSGALGDLGAHIIDLARFLVGEPRRVSGALQTYIGTRPDAAGQARPVDVDDAFVATLEFESGALGTLEATRYAAGRKNHNAFEINGEKGSLRFNLERLNELDVFWVDEGPRETQGIHTVLVSERHHPFWASGWPQGHVIGWEDTFVYQAYHLLEAIVQDKAVAPFGATFEDGYKNAVICDAIIASAASGRRLEITY